MFKEFNELVTKLQSTRSRLQIESYLKEYIDNTDVKTLLHFLFNPYIITGISTKKVNKYKNTSVDVLLKSTEMCIDAFTNYFKLHGSGRDEDIKVMEAYAQALPEYRELIYSLVTKELKLGVSAVTLNKIYGKGFIPQFEVQLAEKYFDNPDKYVPEGTKFILTQKLDGVRCVCIKRYDGTISFYSRQGQPFLDLIEIEEEAKQLPCGFVYDGELLLVNDKDLPSKDLYRATVKVVNSDNVKKGVRFHCFDMLPLDDFYAGISNIPSITRKEMLERAINDCTEGYIINVPILYEGTDKNAIQYHLDLITKNAGEGVMINISDSPYLCKRCRGLLKVKKMQTCDIRCVGVEEGTGSFSGTLGAIQCQFIGPDGKLYPVRVGSGFSLDYRNLLWNTKELIINKIVEVQYFEITTNEQGTYSLRFPVFKHIREDKTEISMY